LRLSKCQGLGLDSISLTEPASIAYIAVYMAQLAAHSTSYTNTSSTNVPANTQITSSEASKKQI